MPPAFHAFLESPSLLTESRVGRILRPLINKCGAHSSLSTSAYSCLTVPVTYAARANRHDNTGLSQPSSLSTYYLASESAPVADINRRSSEVRSAFRNVLRALYGPPQSVNMIHGQIPSLGDMCGLVLGANMSQSTLSKQYFEDELLERELFNSIYTDTPNSYKRYLLSTQCL
jgi:hypothetical protein